MEGAWDIPLAFESHPNFAECWCEKDTNYSNQQHSSSLIKRSSNCLPCSIVLGELQYVSDKDILLTGIRTFVLRSARTSNEDEDSNMEMNSKYFPSKACVRYHIFFINPEKWLNSKTSKFNAYFFNKIRNNLVISCLFNACFVKNLLIKDSRCYGCSSTFETLWCLFCDINVVHLYNSFINELIMYNKDMISIEKVVYGNWDVLWAWEFLVTMIPHKSDSLFWTLAENFVKKVLENNHEAAFSLGDFINKVFITKSHKCCVYDVQTLIDWKGNDLNISEMNQILCKIFQRPLNKITQLNVNAILLIKAL